MVGALHQLEVDGDVALVRELGDELGDFGVGYDFVLVSMDDEAGRGTRGQEAEIVHVGRRCDRDETVDLRPAHQQLHADPGAEGKTRHPAGAGIGIGALQPVEGSGGVAQLALAVIEHALGAADAAEIETQNRKTAAGEDMEQGENHLVVHGATALRMRVEHQRNGGVRRLAVMVPPLKAAIRPVEDDVRHS